MPTDIVYGRTAMRIYDGPGSGSRINTLGHSHVISKGLGLEPFNGVFVCVEFKPRIVNDIIAGSFIEVGSMLKQEILQKNVVVQYATK